MININQRKKDLEERTLGEGAYGKVSSVRGDPTKAKKSFESTRDLVPEAAMLLYLRDVPNILRIVNFNVEGKIIISERWDQSLRTLISTRSLSYQQKLIIFKDILVGLSNLHGMNIVHGDLKMSNILIKRIDSTYRACICDVGLTSLTKYAKISMTADIYRPSKLVRYYSHDMFGLCVSMCKVFGNIKIDGGKSEKQLSNGRTSQEIRSLIQKCTNFPNKKIREVLLSLVPNNPLLCPTANDILRIVFDEEKVIVVKPSYQTYDNISTKEIVEYVHTSIIGLCKTYSIKRDIKCSAVVLNHINGPDFSGDYELCIISTLVIFSSLFGSELPFSTAEAIRTCRGKFNRLQIHSTTTDLLNSRNYRNHMLS